MCSSAWRDSVPLFIASIVIGSGLRTGFLHAATPKMKCCFGQLAPVEAIPCSNEVRGSEAYKRKTGGNLVLCTGLVLQIRIIN